MQDKSFMEELYKLMEDELSNSELDIIHITEMLHISRTKFYYGSIVSTSYDIINIYIYIYINNKVFSKNGGSKNKLYIV